MSTSDIEAIWHVALLEVQHLLLGLLEVLFVYSHTALAKGDQTGLSAHCLDIGSGQVVFSRDQLFELHVVGQAHLGGVDLEDFVLGF